MDFNAVIFKYLGDSLTLVKNLSDNLKKQTKKIEELEEKLRVNSQNSSKPPSTDFNKKKKKKKFHTKKSNNKPGGQPGHKGTNRKLEENPDRIIKCVTDENCRCGGKVFRESYLCTHQVTELVNHKKQVIEFRIEKGICNICSLRHKGSLPEGFSYYCLGPNAISTIANLTSRFRLSRQKVVEFFKEFFDIKISKGTVSNHEKIISNAIKPCYDDLLDKIKKEPVVHADETTHIESTKKHWVWIGVSSDITVFAFNKSRGKKAAQNLLGTSFMGYLVSDRYSAYNFVPSNMRQICWAHLKRDIRKISERSGEPGRLGDQMLSTFYKIYSYWNKFQANRIDREYLIKSTKILRKNFKVVLIKAKACGHKATENTCKNIYKLLDSLWQFIFIDNIEPTNNIAERQIREYVIKRKLSHGSRSERGTRFLERIYSVVHTCKQKNIKTLEFIEKCVYNYFSNKSPPLLL